MNTFGNLGSAVSPVLLAYLVGMYGWNMPFLVCAGLCVAGAALTMGINADQKIVWDAPSTIEGPRLKTCSGFRSKSTQMTVMLLYDYI